MYSTRILDSKLGLLCTSLDRTDSPRIIIYEKSLLKVRSCTTDQLYTPGCACTGVRRANFFLVLRPAVPSGNTHTRKLTSMRSAYRYPEVQKPTGSARKNSRSLHSSSIVRHPVCEKYTVEYIRRGMRERGWCWWLAGAGCPVQR